MDYTEIKETGQKYHVKGQSPSLLIVSGTHGDEYEVVPLVEEAVSRYYSRLPDLLYIPEISPSAVANRTRINDEGLDVNRCFSDLIDCKEAEEMKKLWEKFSFELFITFHEDPTQNKFYLYDGFTEENKKRKLEGTAGLQLLRKGIKAAGVELYNGIDDLEDPNLGYSVKDGYVHWPMINNDCSSDYWLLVEAKICKQVVNPEIPGKISIDKKRKIVEATFRRLLLDEIE